MYAGASSASNSTSLAPFSTLINPHPTFVHGTTDSSTGIRNCFLPMPRNPRCSHLRSVKGACPAPPLLPRAPRAHLQREHVMPGGMELGLTHGFGHSWSGCFSCERGLEASPTTASSNTSPLSFKVHSTTLPDSSTT